MTANKFTSPSRTPSRTPFRTPSRSPFRTQLRSLLVFPSRAYDALSDLVSGATLRVSRRGTLRVVRRVIQNAVVLGLCNIASLALAAPGSGSKVGVKAGILDGVLNAGPVVQLLLLMMIFLSVASWAVIFTKWRQYNTLKNANARFHDLFWKASSLEDVFEKVSETTASSQGRVFRAAYMELQRIAESGLAGEKIEGGTPVRLAGIDNLERTLRKSVDAEIALCESRLNFLATTGSTSPFIGLLGTVIGIMTSFANIAASGSASLAVVAPGISEALFATAIGLFAALPAVAAYNYFISEVRRFEMDLNSFGSDFLNIAKRNFFKAE